MKIKINKFYLKLLLFFIISQNVFSQEKTLIKTPLKEILNTIATQHNVSFNYIDEQIVVFEIQEPDKNLSLSEKLNHISQKTGLYFEILDDNFITIVAKKKYCGFIYDTATNLPIENVSVKIPGSNQTVTAKNGYFEIFLSKDNAIQISCIGYTPIVFKAQNAVRDCQKIFLEPKIEILTEVIAQQYLASGMSKRNDGAFEVKPKKFGILPGLIEPDILQTIQQIPGIYSADETISNINVRGGTHDQNLFLWNGIRIFQTGHFFGLISAFNPSLAHNIKIYKNGTSAFYGESMSSLVAISTHTPEIESANSSVGANLISADFYTKIKTSATASFEISGRRSFTDLVASPTYQKYYDRIFQNTIITDANNQNVDYKADKNFYFYDFTAQFQKKIGITNELIIDFIGISNHLDFNQTYQNGPSFNTKNSNLSQQNYGGNLYWKTLWNTKNTTQFNIYTSYYNLFSRNESLQDNQVLNQKNTVLDTGFKVENNHILNANFSINNGYQFNEIGVTNIDIINTPIFSRKNKEVIRSHALVLESVYENNKKTNFLKAGMRINYFEQFNKLLFEPRVQFNIGITNALNVEVLGEIKSQTSSQIIDLQSDFLGIEKRRWVLSNNGTIPIQKNQQFSVGFTYKKNEWLVVLDNFYKKVIEISSNSQGFQNQLEFINTTGEYSVLGTEFLIQKNFNHFYTWINYNWNDNNYVFKAYQANAFSNNVSIPNSLSWAGVYEWNNLKIALGSKWFTGKPTTTPANDTLILDNPSEPRINYNTPNNERLEDYFQVNFSASNSWQFSTNTKLQLGISVLNILNKKNIINSYFRVNSTNNTIENIKTYSLERTPNLSLKLFF